MFERGKTSRDRIGERGQAAVSLIASLPFAALLLLICCQLAMAGHAQWSAGVAARAAARASLIGSPAPQAARRALPAYLRDGLEVRRGPDGRAEVEVRVPALVPGLPRIAVGSVASLGQG